MSSYKLHEGQIAEIKELYLGTNASARELSKIFKVSEACIKWNVDKKFRRRHKYRMMKYHHKHRDRL